MTCRSPRHCPGLADVRLTSSATLPLLRRVLNANFRLGRAEHAAVLADVGRAVGPARRGARAGPGDAGHVGEAVGPRSGDGALAADSATSGSAGRRRASAQAGRAPGFDPDNGPNGGRCRHRGAWHQGGRRPVGDARRRSEAARQGPRRSPQGPRSTDRSAADRGRPACPALARFSESDRGASGARQGRSRRGDRPLARPARARLDRRTARGHRGAGRHAR